MERSILKLRRIQKVRNVDIRERTKLTDALEHALQKKWRWAGHLARYTDRRWTSETTKWKGPRGKRKVGRPKMRWDNDIKEIAGKHWLETAKDKKRWKELEEAYTRKGTMQ